MKIYPLVTTAICSLTVFSLPLKASTGITPLICQNQKCFLSTEVTDRETLFNYIHDMLKKSTNKPIALCEANPTSKSCVTKGISFPITTAYTQNNIEVLNAKLLDTKKVSQTSGIDLIIDYKVKIGDIFPDCQTAPSRLGLLEGNTIQVVAPEFSCYLTHSSATPISIVHHVDYVDLDNKIIGAYYAASAGDVSFGNNKTGYVLLQLNRETPISFSLEQMAHPSQSIIAQQSTEPHTQVAPIWMKPTPFLNLEKPTYVDQDCMHTPQGCAQLMINSNGVQSNEISSNYSTDIASTTGLIEQDKIILPPTNGIRKTVKIKKQVFENGKQISVEEDVQEYIQETPDDEFISQKEAEIKELQSQLQIPEMPKPIHNLSSAPQIQNTSNFVTSNAIVLSAEEIAQIERESGYQINPNAVEESNQLPVVIESKSIEKTQPIKEKTKESFFEKIEKYLYF